MITELNERELLKELNLISCKLEKHMDKCEKIEDAADYFRFSKPTHKKQRRIRNRRKKRFFNRLRSKLAYHFHQSYLLTNRGDKIMEIVFGDKQITIL